MDRCLLRTGTAREQRSEPAIRPRLLQEATGPREPMSRSSSSSSSRWRSSGQPWWQSSWGHAKRPGSHQGPVPSSLGTGARKEPLQCRDMVVQNALYTGDLAGVQRYFSERAEVNLVIQAKSHDLRWTSQKWGGSTTFGSIGLHPPPTLPPSLGPEAQAMDPIVTHKAEGLVLAFWRALLAGDGCALLGLLGDPKSGVGPNVVFNTSDLDEWKNYRSNSRWLRLWSLTYEQELTTPLHITASRGYLDCLRHLLLRGADVDLAPGGQTALHAACAAATTECARLLLSFGADPAAVSEEGFQPLHLCRSPASAECARLLLRQGAKVNALSEEERDSPLHVAARLGLPEHVRLFLSCGADLEARNAEGQTPLNAACAQPHPPQAADDYYDSCLQLVEAGACVDAADLDRQRPLHHACKTASHRVVALLLSRGANVNLMSYSGNTPLHNILQGAAYRLQHRPELAARHLLNHGAVRVWPGALLKVLRHCCASPRCLEALLNCYERVPVKEEWAEAVPEELVQEHPRFFQSLFALGQSPRALQHLARCALRSHLEGRLLQAIPKLHLPPVLQEFLLLRFEDVLY